MDLFVTSFLSNFSHIFAWNKFVTFLHSSSSFGASISIADSCFGYCVTLASSMHILNIWFNMNNYEQGYDGNLVCVVTVTLSYTLLVMMVVQQWKV